MSFDPASLIVALVLGSIGFVGLMYGKRQARFPHMVAGLALMVFPYFVPNPWLMGGIGAAVIALWFAAVRFGGA